MTGRSPSRPSAPPPAPKVAVGSRAEAKALREAALNAQREREKARRDQERNVRSRRVVDEFVHADEAEGRVCWTAFDAAVVLGVMLASLLGADAILGSRGVALMPPVGQTMARALTLGVFHMIQLGALALLAGHHGSRLPRAFGLSRLERGFGHALATAVLAIGLLVATRVISTLWGVGARAAGWEPPAAGEITAVFGAGGSGLLVAIVIFVIIGPFAEELAFRGVILTAAGARFGKWPAIVLTAVAFAAYHFTPWTFVPLFGLGVALGWLAWTRRSLWGAIALHALYNGVVVGAAYWLAQ